MSFQNQLISRLGNNTKYLSELSQNILRPLLQLAVRSLEHENVPEGALDKLVEKFDQPLIDEWYFVILTIVRLHLRYSAQLIHQAEMRTILQDLKFSSNCVEDIITVLYGPKRINMITNFSKRTNLYPELESINWRIDIAISSSVLPRILEPHIVMQWTLSNGEKHIFHIPIKKFHQLRHLVAKLLLEIITIENSNSIKSLSRD